MLKTKSCGVIVVLVLSAIVGTGIVLADDTTIEIDVAPATLNLNTGVQECEYVTVHTNISYWDVNRSCDTLELSIWNGTLNEYVVIATDPKCCIDDCGDLVAKFDQKDVVPFVEAGEVYELKLTGKTNGGTSFEGTDTIRVIDSGKTQ